MAHKLSIALFAAALACTPMKRVPEESVSEIPPDQVQIIEQHELEVEQQERDLAVARVEANQAHDELDAERERVGLWKERIETEEDLKRSAVERGDDEAARGADLRRATAERDLEAAERSMSSADHKAEVADAKLALAKADLALSKAELELAKANASRDVDIDMDRYEEQAERARDRVEEAKRELENLER